MNKLYKTFLIVAMAIAAGACAREKSKTTETMDQKTVISANAVKNLIKEMTDSIGKSQTLRIERGVKQTAGLWRKEDGDEAAWTAFCKMNFIADSIQLNDLFSSLDQNFETLFGFFNRIDLKLKERIHLVGPEVTPIDELFGGYDVSAHFQDDMYDSKIGLITALNFPYYTLEEKTNLGKNWNTRQWAYARMGDMFKTRIPANIKQNTSQTLTSADNYISNYNIYMGCLINEAGEQLFPKDMALITHWGLRDELKSNYGAVERGLEKQRMVYEVMKRIIDQSIPSQVINSNNYLWNPVTNRVLQNGKEVEGIAEEDIRYQVLLDNFIALKKEDVYYPDSSTYIRRAFELNMEIPQEDVRALFVELVSSPQIKRVASLISERLGRPLEPFDIWYNGFTPKPLPEEKLTAITQKLYPNNMALKADLPNILVKLGWKPERAKEIASLVSVDAARGSGHAWGAQMKNDQAHLRTRIQPTGMDYKGYNIAIHEFGHNVEQTITMNDVPYFVLNGVPNTAFTEAVAFLFQKRDLDLLGMTNNDDPDKEDFMALKAIWDCYEIMGVSLVDMKVWEWMYANPGCNKTELKEAVITIAKEVWNKYYADVLGGKDQPLLAIYSHMIDNPLYLPNYPMGHLIDFQLEDQVRGKNIADELQRMYIQGRLVPQVWMQRAVGKPIGVEPVLKAVDKALIKFGK